jgi:hypothetical protein
VAKQEGEYLASRLVGGQWDAATSLLHTPDAKQSPFK